MERGRNTIEVSRVRYAWVVAAVTCLALMAVAGVRSSFGVFVQPLQQEFGWDRSAISVTAVLSMLLYGALGPLAGRRADRYGSRWILVVSVCLAGMGAIASSTMSRLWQFHLYYGVITSIGAGGAAMVLATRERERRLYETLPDSLGCSFASGSFTGGGAYPTTDPAPRPGRS